MIHAPWTMRPLFSHEVNGYTLHDANGSFVAVAVYRGGTDPAKETARDILAAVNACAGIPTEALEADVVRRMREALVVFAGLCDAYAHDGVENAQKSRDLVRQLLKEVDGQ